MNFRGTLNIAASVFWAFIAPAVAELEAVWSGKLLKENHTNEELGLILSVKERPLNQRKGHGGGSAQSEESEDDGVKRANQIRESDERSTHCSLPLKQKVIWKLICEDAGPRSFNFSQSQFSTDLRSMVGRRRR